MTATPAHRSKPQARQDNPGDSSGTSDRLSTGLGRPAKLSLPREHRDTGLRTAFKFVQVIEKKGENTACPQKAVPLYYYH